MISKSAGRTKLLCSIIINGIKDLRSGFHTKKRVCFIKRLFFFFLTPKNKIKSLKDKIYLVKNFNIQKQFLHIYESEF